MIFLSKRDKNSSIQGGVGSEKKRDEIIGWHIQ